MKNGKKILLSLGTIGSVVGPVGLVIACGSSSDWIFNGKDTFLGNLTWDGFLNEINSAETVTNRSWEIIKEQAAFFYYDKEQKGSTKVQKDEFLWEIKKLEDEKNNLSDQKEKNKITQKINDIKAKIKNIDDNKIPYDSSSFSSDYPKILLPINKIEDKQKQIYENEEATFIDTYSDKAKGQAKWIEEIPKRYDGATSKKEAIKNLTYKLVQNDAFLRNQIYVDNTYTVKQFKWVNDKNNKSNAFPFLKVKNFNNNNNKKTDYVNIQLTGTNDDDKVYFYGTKSNIWGHKDEENLKIIDNNILDELKGLRMYRHVLLNIRPNPKGSTLPWIASRDTIKRLFEFIPGSNTDHQWSRIENIWNNMDKPDSSINDKTKFFLDQVSNNSEGTKHIGGSLGIHKATYFSNAMFNGFALGALELERGKGLPVNDNKYNTLAKAISEAYNEIISSNLKNQTNLALDEYIDSLPQEKLNIFGQKIRDIFVSNALKNITDGTRGRKLLYGGANGGYIFITDEDKGGIHLIKKYDINSKKLNNLAKKDLETMAKEDNPNKAEFNIINLLSPSLNASNTIYKLINPDPNIGSKELQEFKKFLKTAQKNNDFDLSKINGVTTIDNLIDKAKEYQNDQKNIKANKMAQKITNTHYDYLMKKMENGEIISSGTNIFEPKEIYGQAFALANKEGS